MGLGGCGWGDGGGGVWVGWGRALEGMMGVLIMSIHLQ